MVQFKINIKLSTINGKGLNRLIARKGTRNSAIAERPRCRLGSLGVGVLYATYAVHIGFIRKPVVVFLLLMIELFFAWCNG